LLREDKRIDLKN